MNKICFVFSKKDVFSFNVYNKVKKLDLNIYLSDKDVLEIDLPEGYENYVVISRHESKEKTKTLSCHFTGIFGEKLSYANACLIKKAIKLLKEEFKGNKWKKKFYIGVEATHHTPAVDKSVLFLETGSTEEEWNNEEIIDKFANVIEKLKDFEKCKSLIAIGFNHYSRRLTKIIYNTSLFSVAHILPNYKVSMLNYKILEEMYNKSIPKPEGILIRNINEEKLKIIKKFALNKKINVIQID